MENYLVCTPCLRKVIDDVITWNQCIIFKKFIYGKPKKPRTGIFYQAMKALVVCLTLKKLSPKPAIKE